MSILRFISSSSTLFGGPIREIRQSANQFEIYSTAIQTSHNEKGQKLTFSSSASTCTKHTSSNTVKNWNMIYHLPLIKWASAFNRLKIYQGGFSLGGIPIAFMLEASEIIPLGSGVTFATVGLTGLITLLFGSLVVQNLIGFIYINSSRTKLKFSYVDYWGHRKDIIKEIDDLIPDGAQEKPARLNFYQKIGFQSNTNFRLNLLQRYGEVKSQEFYSLFY